jgi:hypothetical protein
MLPLMMTISPLASTVEVPYQRPAFIGALRRVFHAYLPPYSKMVTSVEPRYCWPSWPPRIMT